MHGRVLPRPSLPNFFLKIGSLSSRPFLPFSEDWSAFLGVFLPVGSDQGFSVFLWIVKLSFQSSGPFQKALSLGQLKNFGGVAIFHLAMVFTMAVGAKGPGGAGSRLSQTVRYGHFEKAQNLQLFGNHLEPGPFQRFVVFITSN